LNFNDFELPALASKVLSFIKKSPLLQSSYIELKLDSITAKGSILYLGEANINSYLASVLADFMREALLERKISFTLETVMSHRSKISLLEKA